MKLAEGQESNKMLALARLAPGGKKWEILPTKIDPVRHVAEAQTEFLGVSP